MNVLNTAKNMLKIKNSSLVKVGLDIGGSLTKVSVALSKESDAIPIREIFLKEFQFAEEIELDDNYLYIKLMLTHMFKTEIVEFLKSKLYL